jgi:hypothetical protein
MSRYTVLWLKEAQDELAHIWLESSNRKSVTTAAAQIDALLGNTPAEQGEEISEGLRRMTFPPLQVWFEVRELDRTVEVSNVKLR